MAGREHTLDKSKVHYQWDRRPDEPPPEADHLVDHFGHTERQDIHEFLCQISAGLGLRGWQVRGDPALRDGSRQIGKHPAEDPGVHRPPDGGDQRIGPKEDNPDMRGGRRQLGSAIQAPRSVATRTREMVNAPR